jgi:hypothetical protein
MKTVDAGHLIVQSVFLIFVKRLAFLRKLECTPTSLAETRRTNSENCPRNCYTCCRELHCLFITLPVRFEAGYNESSYSNCVALTNPGVNPTYNELPVIVFKLRRGSPSSSFQSLK